MLVSFAELHAEAIVEHSPLFDDRQTGRTVHRDRELIEEAMLSKEDRPWSSPALRKTDLGIPLYELIIFPSGMQKLNSDVDEVDVGIGAPNSQFRLIFGTAEINAGVSGKPWSRKDVFRT